MTTVAANWTSIALEGPRRGLSTMLASGVVALVLTAGALSLGTAPPTQPALVPTTDVAVSSDTGSAPGLAAPTDMAAEIPVSLPSYYSYQWDETCQEECPARVAD